LQSASKEAGKV